MNREFDECTDLKVVRVGTLTSCKIISSLIFLKTTNSSIRKKQNSNLVNRVTNFEKERWKLSQYSRKNNVDVSGIPESISSTVE